MFPLRNCETRMSVPLIGKILVKNGIEGKIKIGTIDEQSAAVARPNLKRY